MKFETFIEANVSNGNKFTCNLCITTYSQQIPFAKDK